MTRVLFLCTGNSARSILAEYLLRHLAPDRFETASAGSHPKGSVHPMALRVLAESYGIDAGGATSKPMSAVLDRTFDLIVTVCDHARDHCPVWPSSGRREHWGLEDPAAVEGDEKAQRAAFEATAAQLMQRFRAWIAAPEAQGVSGQK